MNLSHAQIFCFVFCCHCFPKHPTAILPFSSLTHTGIVCVCVTQTHGISQYELQQALNKEENEKYLQSLNLADHKPHVDAKAAKHKVVTRYHCPLHYGGKGWTGPCPKRHRQVFPECTYTPHRISHTPSQRPPRLQALRPYWVCMHCGFESHSLKGHNECDKKPACLKVPTGGLQTGRQRNQRSAAVQAVVAECKHKPATQQPEEHAARSQQWLCTKCNLLNCLSATRCGVCHAGKGKSLRPRGPPKAMPTKPFYPCTSPIAHSRFTPREAADVVKRLVQQEGHRYSAPPWPAADGQLLAPAADLPWHTLGVVVLVKRASNGFAECGVVLSSAFGDQCDHRCAHKPANQFCCLISLSNIPTLHNATAGCAQKPHNRCVSHCA